MMLYYNLDYNNQKASSQFIKRTELRLSSYLLRTKFYRIAFKSTIESSYTYRIHGFFT